MTEQDETATTPKKGQERKEEEKITQYADGKAVYHIGGIYLHMKTFTKILPPLNFQENEFLFSC